MALQGLPQSTNTTMCSSTSNMASLGTHTTCMIVLIARKRGNDLVAAPRLLLNQLQTQ